MRDLVAQSLPYFVMREFLSNWTSDPVTRSGDSVLGKTPVSYIVSALSKCEQSIPQGQQQPLFTQISMIGNAGLHTSILPEASSTITVKGIRSHDFLQHPKKVVIDTESGEERTVSSGLFEVIFMGVTLNSTADRVDEEDTDIPFVNLKKDETVNIQKAMLDTVIAVLPTAGIFFSLKRSIVINNLRQFQALPIRWLRFKRKLDVIGTENLPIDVLRPGGYVNRIIPQQVFRMAIQLRLQSHIPLTIEGVDRACFPVDDTTERKLWAHACDDVETISCLQLPDELNSSTIPDYFTNGLFAVTSGELISVSRHRDEGDQKDDEDEEDTVHRSQEENLKLYEERKTRSKPFLAGESCVVKGAMHQNIPEDCFVIRSPQIKGKDRRQYDLLVGIQKIGKDGNSTIVEETTIEIRYGTPSKVSPLKMFLQEVWKNENIPCIPNINFEKGKRATIGQQVIGDKSLGQVRPRPLNSTMNKEQFSNAMFYAKRIAQQEFPGVTRLLHDTDAYKGLPMITLEDGNEKNPTVNATEERTGISNNVEIYFNFGAPTQYKPEMGSKCIQVWYEDIEGKTQDWYLVFPNLLLRRNIYDRRQKRNVVKTFRGVAVKLEDGIMIAYDGKLLRHGPSVPKLGATRVDRRGVICNTYSVMFYTES